MDKTTAQRLVRDTFKAAFDKQRYRDFINEVCNGFDESKAQNMGVPDAFAPHIKSCQRLGTFASPEGELTDVLVVQLTESFKLERTRTALRDFVAHKLKRDESYKEAGLVAFVAPDSQSWRFSYVRMEYETKRDPKTGKIKAEERLTPARRYSYLVGADEECHTAQSRFLALLQNTTDKPTLAQIEEAFSVESVTKEFFREYARLFEDTEAALADVVKRDKALRDEFKAKGVSTVDFSKKLLGQIVFLYFIQKKGWLGVAKGGQWGDGPRNFLRQLANRAISEMKCLFNDVLEPLFYDTLATERGHDAWCKTFACRIPFLNGGLFEPLAGYDWEKTEITLSNSVFTNQTRTDAGDLGSGILDVFDRYNFTVNESEPLEQEVAIDPEMLGKVFENLIEDNRRKGLGAFYTPREIVHYMCQQSLINYLDNGLSRPTTPIGAATPQPALFVDSSEKPKARAAQEEVTDVRQRSLIARKDLEEWILQSDQFAHYAAAIAAGTKGDNYPKPPVSIRKYAHEMDVLLRDVTVCDPAIGSGAFPVGMMMEIVRARMALTPYLTDVAERSAYHFKRHAIQSSIYGVDIDASAVEIAKLRLWLSLVVDEDDVQQIKPLPNLDYKIVVGNSLLGVEKNLFNNAQFKRLEELKPRFFNESDRRKKEQCKTQIEDLIHQLTDGKETFDYEIYFSEVFHAKGGFDVVIANPPYVRQEAIKELKPALKAAGYECFTGTADLLVYFYERGVKLLHGGGALTLITSNKFYRAGYGEKLRGFLARELTLQRLIDFGDAPVFEAIAYASILTGVRTVPTNDASVLAYTWDKELMTFERIAQIVPERGQQVLQSELKPDGWRLESPATFRLMDKFRKAGKPLGEYVNGRFYRGIVTGLNEAFVVDEKTKNRLVAEHASSAEVFRPYIRGRDMMRWTLAKPDCWLIFIPWHFPLHEDASIKGPSRQAERELQRQYPAVYRHLSEFKQQLLSRKKDETEIRYEWYALQRWAADYWRDFAVPKIVYPDIYEHQSFAWDADAMYLANTCYFIPTNEKWLCGLLNSTAVEWFYRMVSNQVRGGYLRAFNPYIETIPIPTVPSEKQKPLERLVERILTAKRREGTADVSGLELELDELVYALYGLTPEEVQLVEAGTK